MCSIEYAKFTRKNRNKQDLVIIFHCQGSRTIQTGLTMLAKQRNAPRNEPIFALAYLAVYLRETDNERDGSKIRNQ